MHSFIRGLSKVWSRLADKHPSIASFGLLVTSRVRKLNSNEKRVCVCVCGCVCNTCSKLQIVYMPHMYRYPWLQNIRRRPRESGDSMTLNGGDTPSSLQRASVVHQLHIHYAQQGIGTSTLFRNFFGNEALVYTCTTGIIGANWGGAHYLRMHAWCTMGIESRLQVYATLRAATQPTAIPMATLWL